MTRGRKPLLQDQIRDLCINCKQNMQAPASNSSLGFKRFISLCSSCNRKKYNLYKEKYKKQKKQYCERCGFLAINKCQLDIHHVDGNHYNNSIENLETLCANCHRLHHFK